jgi:predicted metal-dependent enzyme (double-stranded beta helix superfamily)
VTLLSDVAALSQTAPGQVLSGQARLSRARLSQARLSQACLRELVAAVAAREDSWAGLVRFDAGRRWYRRLELAGDREVWLLSWLPGQATGFHDHGHAAGAFAVAQGRLRERTVATEHGQARQRTVARGSIRSFGPRYVHDVANACTEPAVTVHAYSPPLTDMRRYELTESGLIHTATEHAEQDW